MSSRESEPKPIYIEGGNPHAIIDYLRRSIGSAQSETLAAEFSLKRTSRLNILRKRRLNAQARDAKKEIKRLLPVLINLEAEETAISADSQQS